MPDCPRNDAEPLTLPDEPAAEVEIIDTETGEILHSEPAAAQGEQITVDGFSADGGF